MQTATETRSFCNAGITPTVIDYTLRNKSDQIDIFDAVQARLIECIDELNADSCMITDAPVPKTMPYGRHIVTLCLGPSRYPHEFFASSRNVMDDGSILITAIVKISSDRPRHRRYRTLAGNEANSPPLPPARAKNESGPDPSLIYFKREILRALFTGWEPTKLVGNDVEKPLLRDEISPLNSGEVQTVIVGEAECAAQSHNVSVPFDWDLTGG